MYIVTTATIIMPYSLKPNNDVICQCGCIVNKYYIPKHLRTRNHEQNMVGREGIGVAEAWNEVAEAWKYKPPVRN